MVCDIDMPGMDGFGVLTRLRTETATAAIPFIFVTSRDDAESRELALHWGADEYITKNRVRYDLAPAVRGHLAPALAAWV